MKAMATAIILALGVGATACGGGHKKVEEPVAGDDDGAGQQDQPEEYIVPQEKLDAVQRYMDRQRNFVAYCWGDALEAGEVKSGQSGHMTLSFQVQTDGTVGNIKITEEEPKSKTLERCVLEKAKRWKITTLEKPLDYSFTFGFSNL